MHARFGRAWEVCAGSTQNSLRPLAEELSAHDGRIEGLTVVSGVVFTAGFDGSLKMYESPCLAKQRLRRNPRPARVPVG